jgi:hypothetical protein
VRFWNPRKKRKKEKQERHKRSKNVSWVDCIPLYTREAKTVVHARLDRQSGVFTEVFPSVRRR